MSVLMSLPGPIIVGAALMVGTSSTQLADFVRRTAELLAIIVSLFLYRSLYKQGEPEPSYKAKKERQANLWVGGAMCLSGVAMLFIALFSVGGEQGNVVPGLIIAVLGLVANTLFFFRYSKLDRENPDGILAVQAKLYLAKAFVDGAVTLALGFVLLFPGSSYGPMVDRVGSIVVSIYLIVSGLMTLKGVRPAVKEG